MKNITSINPIIESLLLIKESESPQFNADLSILLNTRILTLKLFDLLKINKLLSEDLEFSTIVPLYHIDNDYFVLNNKIAEYIKLEIEEEDDNINNLFSVLSIYYREQIKNETYDISKYKLLYNEVITILMQLTEREELGDWIINETVNIIYREEYEFLCPIILKVYNFLNDKEKALNVQTKLFNAVLLIFLTKIYKQKNENDNAFLASKLSIEHFEEIKDDIAETKYKDIFFSWYGESYYERGILYFDNNNFFQSISDLYRSSSIVDSYNTTIELSKKYQYIGFYKQAEVELLKYMKWIQDDTELDEYNKRLTNNQLLYELGKYYQNIDLYEESILLRKQHLELEESGEEQTIWQIAALKELGIVSAKKYIKTGSNSKIELDEIKNLLLKSIELFKKQKQDKHNATTFICLAQLEIYDDTSKSIDISLKDAFSLLSQHFIPNNKEYIEYYISYADFLNKQGLTKEYEKLMQFIYNIAKEKLGSHHIINRTIIEKLRHSRINYDFDRELLNYHYKEIERLLSPDIRTDIFDSLYVHNENDIKNIIRENSLAILPISNDRIEFFSYKLPFYENYYLIKLKIDTGSIILHKFFLCKNLENIYLINYSNKIIFNINEQDLIFNNNEDAKKYIKFFFDSVDGRHGKFLIVEETLQNIPWKYDINNQEKEKEFNLINNLVKPINLLFEENTYLDGDECTLWHFSAYMFFKDSLFCSKIELNTKNGVLRIYDEKTVLENLQIIVDIQSTVKD